MKHKKRSFAVVSVLFVLALSLGAGRLAARDADPTPLTVAAAETVKQQCADTCRARYRDCRSLKQVPLFECQNVYNDCVRFTCNAAPRAKN